MNANVDLFYNTYANFNEQVLAAVREETFGQDIGQNSWLTVEEFEQFIEWLDIDAGSHLLEIASGSGGPALHVADKHGCRVTGVDLNPHGVATARRAAVIAGLTHLVKFKVADRVRDRFRAEGHDIVDVDGVRVRFPHGWGLLRASNTQPILVMRFEAETPAQLDEYKRTVEVAVAAARAEVGG